MISPQYGADNLCRTLSLPTKLTSNQSRVEYGVSFVTGKSMVDHWMTGKWQNKI